MEARKGTSVNKVVRSMKNLGNSKIIKKKKKKKRIDFLSKFPRLFSNYLKFDSYFYSPVISSSLPPSSGDSNRRDVRMRVPSSGRERNEPVIRNDGEFKEKLLMYLKSDAYLYAPFEETRPEVDDAAVKNVISLPQAQEMPYTRVTRIVLSKKIAWQTKQVTQDSVVDKQADFAKKVPPDGSEISPRTPGIPEVKKHATRSSGRLLTVSG